MHDEGFHYIDDIHSRDKAINWKSLTIFFLYLIILANRQQYHNNPRDMGDEK